MLSFLSLNTAELGVTRSSAAKFAGRGGTTAKQPRGLKRQPLRLKGENLERIRQGMAAGKKSYLARLHCSDPQGEKQPGGADLGYCRT